MKYIDGKASATEGRSVFEILERIPANEAICRYLRENKPSAHSDLAEVLSQATEMLPDTYSYCPNLQQYAYVMYHTSTTIIFALAMGMKDIILRIPADKVEEAFTEQGKYFAEISEEWLRFPGFVVRLSPAANRKRLRKWVEIAFQSVRAMTSPPPDVSDLQP